MYSSAPYSIIYQDGTIEAEMITRNHIRLPIFYEEKHEDMFITIADVFLDRSAVGFPIRVWYQDGVGFKYKYLNNRINDSLDKGAVLVIIRAIHSALTHESTLNQEARRLGELLNLI